MKQTWRWFGANDTVTLGAAREAGAEGIVSALHDAYDGRPWSVDAVAAQRKVIEDAGLEWSVVESIPVHNDIKTGSGAWDRCIEDYRTSMRAVAQNGIRTVCYNFLPLVDWVRTDLRFQTRTGTLALRFDHVDFAAFDLFILRRAGAEADYASDIAREAHARHAAMSESRRAELERIVIAGLPGGTSTYGRAEFERELARFEGLTVDDLRANLYAFLDAVVPLAEELGLNLGIHPDDPPIPLFGLARVASSHADLERIVAHRPSPANGITLCVGSLTSSPDNDALAIATALAPHIAFAHLRNVRRETGLSFHECEHLDGSADMIGIVNALVAEEARRRAEGRLDWEIPMRPDHGHLMLADKDAVHVNPGYSAIGRLRGLAELRGVMLAAQRQLGDG